MILGCKRKRPPLKYIASFTGAINTSICFDLMERKVAASNWKSAVRLQNEFQYSVESENIKARA